MSPGPPRAQPPTAPRTTPLGRFAATWGLLGVLGLLAKAFITLGPLVVAGLGDHVLTPFQWAFLAAWVAWMLYAEGYRGFQGQFSPRVVARAFWLAEHPRPRDVALAPIFVMGFYHATRRTQVVVWVITTMIVCLIIAVGHLPQPWRGIIDLGVLAGLSYGALSIGAILWRGLRSPIGRTARAALPEPSVDDRPQQHAA